MTGFRHLAVIAWERAQGRQIGERFAQNPPPPTSPHHPQPAETAAEIPATSVGPDAEPDQPRQVRSAGRT